LAHQVHGAIGATVEYPLHLLTRSIWAWREDFGSEAEWSRLLGRWAAARGGSELWPRMATIGEAQHD
jgi:acyl-CoA dehydrogenase